MGNAAFSDARCERRASLDLSHRARERLPRYGILRETRRRRLLEERTGHAVRSFRRISSSYKNSGTPRRHCVRPIYLFLVSSYLTTGRFAASGEESPEVRRFCKSLYLWRRQAYLTLTSNKICLPHLRKIIPILFYAR